MSKNGLIYFKDGELIAEQGEARLYQMNDELFLEAGPNHTLWALESELETYMWQLEDYPNGNVLEVGLGLGVASRYLLTFPRVKSLTTIEKNKDIIDLYPRIPRKDSDTFNKNFGHKKHIIHNIDGLSYVYNTNKKYDFVFLDFYDRIDEETLPEIRDMVNGCKRVLKVGGKIMGWLDPHTPEEFVKEFENIFEF